MDVYDHQYHNQERNFATHPVRVHCSVLYGFASRRNIIADKQNRDANKCYDSSVFNALLNKRKPILRYDDFARGKGDYRLQPRAYILMVSHSLTLFYMFIFTSDVWRALSND